MESDTMVATPDGSMIEVVRGESLSLSHDVSDTALLPEGALNGQQVIIVTSSEDGKITGIQALPEFIPAVDPQTGESPAKRIKLHWDQGDQTYMVAVAGDEEDVGQTTLPEEDDSKQESLESTAVEAVEAVAAAAAAAGVPVEEEDDGEGASPVHAPNSDDPKNNVVSQEWFTTKDDKTALQSQGHSWKQGQWSREEIEMLKSNILTYCKERQITEPAEIIFEMSKDERKDFYRTIARGLQRPLFSVYRRVIRMYDRSNHIGKYTPEELAKLSELRMKHGPDWATIGATMGRSASSVKDRCRLMKDTCNSGKWLPEEERRLASAVYELAGCQPGDSVTSGLSWSMVADRVGTRSEKQCRTKWLNYLNWKQKGGTDWTREDDITLVLKIANSGATDETTIDWQELAQRWPSVRSPQWLRGKWWSMKRHVPDYQNLSFQEIVDYLRSTHSHNYRVKPPASSASTSPSVLGTGSEAGALRVRASDLQRVGVVPNMAVTVPVSMTEAAGDVRSVTVGSDEGNGAGATYQAYEILQTLGGNTPHQGAFLITQPQSNPAISFHTANMATDHIIVHTLPLAHGNDNVAVQMDPSAQVLISPAGEEAVTALQVGSVATLQLSDTDQGLQLTESANIEDAQISATELVSREPMTPQPEIIAVDDTFETQAITEDDMGTEVSTADLEGTEVVISDLVMAPAASPQFAQASSSETDLIHLSSLSDPMLTSESTDLIGCSSDGEGDKSQSHDTDS